jgi:hypothetical protein
MGKPHNQYTAEEIDLMNSMLEQEMEGSVNGSSSEQAKNPIIWARLIKEDWVTSTREYMSYIYYLPYSIYGERTFLSPDANHNAIQGNNRLSFPFCFYKQIPKMACLHNEDLFEDLMFFNNSTGHLWNYECNLSPSDLESFRHGKDFVSYKTRLEILKNPKDNPCDFVSIKTIKKHTYLKRLFNCTTKVYNGYVPNVGWTTKDVVDLYLPYSLLDIKLKTNSLDSKIHTSQVLFSYNMETNERLCLNMRDYETKKLLTECDLKSFLEKKNKKNGTK